MARIIQKKMARMVAEAGAGVLFQAAALSAALGIHQKFFMFDSPSLRRHAV
jgi:hypothetical protein